MCQICNKAFNQKNALNIHIKKHTGEKPHKCDYCELSFSQKGNLKTHIKRAHHMDMVHSMNLPKTLYVPPSAGGLDEEMNAKDEGSTAEEDQINLEQVAQELFPQWGVYRSLLTSVSVRGSVQVAVGFYGCKGRSCVQCSLCPLKTRENQEILGEFVSLNQDLPMEEILWFDGGDVRAWQIIISYSSHPNVFII